jgi:hypothetical protein
MINPNPRDLSNEYILHQGRNPRHFPALEHASHAAHGYNPA